MAAASSYSNRHREQKFTRDADEAEVAAMRLGSATTEAGAADERIAGTLGMDEENAGPQRPTWQQDDLASENLVGRVKEEIERRAMLMGSAYPFELTDGGLSYRPSKLGFYEFCLAVSTAPTITSGHFVDLPRDFERVVGLVVKGHLGPHAGVLHTGAPRDADVGTGFTAAMTRLAEMTGEWHWNPEENLPEENNLTGDEGMDFVAWKPFLDRRPGQIFVLGQCACGDDWKGKFHDLSWPRIRKWFRPEVFPEPMRVFATPHHIVDAMLREAQREAGLVLDRARLTLMAAELAGQDEVENWVSRLAQRRALVIPSVAA